MWAKTYGGSSYDEAYAVAIAPNGDIIVAGWTVSFGAGYKDVWVLRLDENGELPYSDMVKDSSAEVEATNADIGNKNAEIETPDVVVKSTDVNPRDSNANIETQYSKYDQALKAIKNAEGFLSDSKTLGQAKAAFEKGDYVTAYQLAMKAEQAKKTRQTLFALMLIALAGAVAGMYYRSQKKERSGAPARGSQECH
ncbi:NHL repeat-containing protein [Thermococcus litoralis]|uniref:hypothetical protein n=1 Tax=Thermococcus litoralis TaxID=2265 RepID=UPI001180F395|nr:hypothetical protein [Thermococcus litoralis]